ncbi:holliday junction resolvasome DNA-binding subunit [Corynebacterium glutamicum MB001]|uniref:Holliday junction branch migration complex subunit RuvA n=2 Tax=Corynebacterium TaxID=1716 RepID=RUVA_CORGL|nr:MULTISPECIES: Holliday junction branch migration protein RuvA [Corynebacterium]Q9AE10.1 RecName: Full=Holliday junction branch migration complex subunit RuvA [Corynebacterium glutamicum ATCC 13032]AAK19839.1 Holliday junction DNA-helicase RuvA [Corynebacterium glutamicum]AGT05616.1 holliday junction resolvasome DNA-binding subunit [Corynebacterium glutamicum MB001]AIK85316.1 ATP-dependent DNA helicase RuvA [Corynebacterium glutamicum]AIK88101.1 ATP-dependent DNA helicase RuvA [Corynebacteri
MIASLRGTVINIGLSSAVIECNGVGYEVVTTPNTLSQLVRGEEALVLTTMVVREDAMKLYGFIDNESREMFSVLQTVSGLGPRLALACESVLSPLEISQAITNADAKTLQRVPGVGKRMADRLIVELKGKVAAFAAGVVDEGGEQISLPNANIASEVVVEQVSQALVGLGFSEKQSDDAVSFVLAADPSLDTSGALRAALAKLSGK